MAEIHSSLSHLEPESSLPLYGRDTHKLYSYLLLFHRVSTEVGSWVIEFIIAFVGCLFFSLFHSYQQKLLQCMQAVFLQPSPCSYFFYPNVSYFLQTLPKEQYLIQQSTNPFNENHTCTHTHGHKIYFMYLLFVCLKLYPAHFVGGVPLGDFDKKLKYATF